MPFVSAYSTVTGAKQRIPAHWLETGSPFHGQFRKTPLARAREDQTLSPFDAMTVDQLQEYAAQHRVDVAGLTRKADLVKAVSAPPTEPDNGQTEGEARA